MNTATRALGKLAAARGVHAVGIEDGYEGLLAGRFRELTHDDPQAASGVVPTAELDELVRVGGTALGSSRSERFRTAEGRAEAAEVLKDFDGLVVIGGNGSLTGAHLLATEHDVRVMTIPASIDNDIGCTASAIGVDTALNTIVEACDRISDTARAHRRVFVVEVMGRESGYLAMASSVAAGADAALFRELGRSEAELVEHVEQIVDTGFARGHKRCVLIIKSEAVRMPCTRMARELQERLTAQGKRVEVRGTVLGHLVRGGMPTYQDRMVAGRLAFAALEGLADGATDEMVAWQPPVPGGRATADPTVRRYPLAEVLEETRRLLDGTSEVTRWRVQMMRRIENVLGL
jgi:6-phosphofructokinase 1